MTRKQRERVTKIFAILAIVALVLSTIAGSVVTFLAF